MEKQRNLLKVAQLVSNAAGCYSMSPARLPCLRMTTKVFSRWGVSVASRTLVMSHSPPSLPLPPTQGCHSSVGRKHGLLRDPQPHPRVLEMLVVLAVWKPGSPPAPG